jgi:methylated-DNA-protein-cysteine methyltransferase related protein
MTDRHFSEKVNKVVNTIPEGRVMTYGDIAILCGQPRAARIVGGVAHFGDSALPWHRVVNRFGGLAAGYPGGREMHKKHLESEGVMVGDDYQITHFSRYRWSPLA